eukprot:Rmarinus@m.10266
MTLSEPRTSLDSSDRCKDCGRPFTVFLRRNHCRICGTLVCEKCISHINKSMPDIASQMVKSKKKKTSHLFQDKLFSKDLTTVKVCQSCRLNTITAASITDPEQAKSIPNEPFHIQSPELKPFHDEDATFTRVEHLDLAGSESRSRRPSWQNRGSTIAMSNPTLQVSSRTAESIKESDMDSPDLPIRPRTFSGGDKDKEDAFDGETPSGEKRPSRMGKKNLPLDMSMDKLRGEMRSNLEKIERFYKFKTEKLRMRVKQAEEQNARQGLDESGRSSGDSVARGERVDSEERVRSMSQASGESDRPSPKKIEEEIDILLNCGVAMVPVMGRLHLIAMVVVLVGAGYLIAKAKGSPGAVLLFMTVFCLLSFTRLQSVVREDPARKIKHLYHMLLLQKAQVKLYSHVKFKGECLSLTPIQTPYILGVDDPQVSSLIVPNGVRVKLYSIDNKCLQLYGPKMIADLREEPFVDEKEIPLRLPNQRTYLRSWDKMVTTIEMFPNPQPNPPDAETARWFTTCLRNVWPELNILTSNAIIESLKPLLDYYRPTYVDAIELRKLTLGDKPPTVNLAKAYEHDGADLQVDLDLEWDTEAHLAIHAKIVGMRGFKPHVSVALDQISIKAKVRISASWNALGIAGWCPNYMAVSFVEAPELTYNLRPVGVDMNSLPMLKMWIHNSIMSALDFMTLPNVYEMPFEEWWNDMADGDDGGAEEGDVELSRRSSLIGKLKVEVVSARNLTVGIGGVTNAYLKLYCDCAYHKTKVVKRESSPVWNEHVDFKIHKGSQQLLKIAVFDWNRMMSNDCIGTCVMDFAKIKPNEFVDVDLPFVSPQGQSAGTLRLIIFYHLKTWNVPELQTIVNSAHHDAGAGAGAGAGA